MPLKGEFYIKNDKTHIQVVYSKNNKVLIHNFYKVKIGQYKPGYIGPVIHDNDTYQGRYGCIHLLEYDEFEKYLSQIKNEHHNLVKITLIYQLIKNQCITVSQLKQTLLTLSKKSDQIEIAKFAWAYVYDQENYNILQPMFSDEFTNILEYVHVNQ